MYLKNDKITMVVGGITFHSHNIVPAPKFLFDQTALIGWTDGVDIKRNDAPRPVSDGDFAEPMNFTSRVIIATGIAIANSVDQIHRMRDDFIGILANKKYQSLSVTDGSGTRYATVSLSNKSGWIQETDTTAVWKLEMYAPDPYIYGAEQKMTLGADIVRGGLDYPISYPLDFSVIGVDNSQTIVNNGNAVMWPTVIARGDFYSGFTISDSFGKKVTYNGVVTQAAPVSINMAQGTAIQSGVDKSTYLSERNWLSAEPYSSIVMDFKPIQEGPGWCEIVFRNTWI